MDTTEPQQASGTHNASVEVPARPELKIFINYRHDDMSGTAWAVYGQLKQRFGAERVFFDNGTLMPGSQWLDEIKSHVAGAGVFLSLIGPKWTSALIERMRRGGEDYVAKEIALAFQAGPDVTVVPLLVDDTELPDPDELPPSIKALTGCQVQRLRHTSLEDDMDRLMDSLDARARNPVDPEVLSEPAKTPSARVAVSTLTAEIGVDDLRREPAGGGDDRSASQRELTPIPGDDHYQSVVDEADNIVVFLGAAVNADDHGGPWSEDGGRLPDDIELARYLAGKVKLTEPLDLAEVAQRARTLRGEPRVFQWVKKAVASQPDPGRVHRYLARFPKRLEELGLEKHYQMIITTTYDAELERAFRLEREPFDVAVYMGPGTDQPGMFVHVPWDGSPSAVSEPNSYLGFPITEDGQLQQTVIVRVNGVVDDRELGYKWKDNYVITEDHYIDYLSGRTAEDLIPAQILAKLQEASCLFLGYTMADWRLRVFLKRIWKGEKLGRARSWAIERDPDELERQLWLGAGVELYGSRLTDYMSGLDAFLVDHVDALRP